MSVATLEKPPVEHHGYQIPHKLAWRTGRLDRFREVSDEHIDHLRAFGALDTARHVVEIGCGVGRDAIPLTGILPRDGSYLGIDIMPPSIAWATDNITAQQPHFRFVCFDVADTQHNPGGTRDMTTYAIPAKGGSTDLIFLYSVFTHMFPTDVAHYLAEFARILRPGGRVLASMFTMDAELIPYLERIGGGGLRNLTFAHEVEPGFFHNDPAVVPGATAYSLTRVRDMATAAGLMPARFVRGSWRKDRGGEVNGQDLVILQKPGF
ncbi:MAG: class I SAM-dependent methyltransferase [Pseudomonadota bacterium]